MGRGEFMIRSALALGFCGVTALSAGAEAVPPGMARIPAGAVAFPFRGDSGAAIRAKVDAFLLDTRAVTNTEFLAFARRQPRYRRSQISRLFADDGYLRAWTADLRPAPLTNNSPVTAVSWHAAKAYCADRGKRLPTTAEWEYAAASRLPGADSADQERAILAWYARPAHAETPAVGTGTRHGHGAQDLHGVIWEWTADFNAWAGGGMNARGVKEEGLTCGGAPAGMAANTPYSTYMRWAFRSSLKPDFTVATLGFRCARDDSPPGD
jgi:sulfatase modifying factor 1